MLLHAVRVLERADARAAAERYLRSVAAGIGDAAMAAGFLALPPHAALLAG